MDAEARTVNPAAPGGGLLSDTRKLASDIAAAWATFPHREFFWAMLAAWVLLFHFWGSSTFGYIKTGSLFGWMIHVYEWSPEDQHGYFIPLLVLMLLWWKRAELLPLPKQTWWPALFLLAAAAGLHVVGFLAQQARLSILGFYLGVYALSGLVWGWRWLRATVFPFCLFVFCVPLATQSDNITFPLRLVATKITVLLSHGLLGVPVIQNGTQIFDPTGRFQYDIAAACSGIQSLTALFVITMIYGFIFFQSAWKRAVILLVAVPAAVVSNVLRLLLIVTAAQLFGQEGGNYVHNSRLLSFLPYLVGFALVFLTGRWLKPGKSVQPAGGQTA